MIALSHSTSTIEKPLERGRSLVGTDRRSKALVVCYGVIGRGTVSTEVLLVSSISTSTSLGSRITPV